VQLSFSFNDFYYVEIKPTRHKKARHNCMVSSIYLAYNAHTNIAACSNILSTRAKQEIYPIYVQAIELIMLVHLYSLLLKKSGSFYIVQ